MSGTIRLATYSPFMAQERYVLRRQHFRVFGAAFYIDDASGRTVGFCEQAAFRLKESLTVFTSPAKSEVLLTIRARSIIDFSGFYDAALPDGSVFASFQREGIKSLFRDSWRVFDADGSPIGQIKEESGTLAFFRRFLNLGSFLTPQVFDLTDPSGVPIASFRTHRRIIGHRLGVTPFRDDDDLVLIAAACLLVAIEGPQSDSLAH